MVTKQLDCVLFTNGHMLQCTTPLQEKRFLDVLNDPHTDFLKVFDVRVAAEPCNECPASVRDGLLSKSSIRLAIPVVDKHEAPERRYNAFVTKQEHPAFLLVDGFEICGSLHLKGRDDPAYVMSREAGRFIPLTEAKVSHRGKLVYEHSIAVVFVNKGLVEMFHIAEQAANTSSSILASLTTAS